MTKYGPSMLSKKGDKGAYAVLKEQEHSKGSYIYCVLNMDRKEASLFVKGLNIRSRVNKYWIKRVPITSELSDSIPSKK